ncbi:hypothetical protein ACVDG8_013075 [Mesorhizobium sp. ORM8.1]
MKAALSAVEGGLALMPDNYGFRHTHADILLHKLRDMETGLPVMRQLVEDAIDKKFEAVSWMAMALKQLFDSARNNSHLPHAERFAMGKELSEEILALSSPQSDGPLKFVWYVPVAQYYYECGNKVRAIELIDVALKSLDLPEPMPDHIKKYYLTPLLQSLANYTGENASYAGLCMVPQKNKAPESQTAAA